MTPALPPRRPARSVLRALNAFTESAWVPLRQEGMVVSLRPDWDTAPRTFGGIGWYAGVLLAWIALGFISQLQVADATAIAREVFDALHAFLFYSLKLAFFVCVYAAIGRWLVVWNCVAKTASPLQLLGMAYTVSAIDQLMRLGITATVSDAQLADMLAAKDLATMALGVMVLVDFFRPRPPAKRRKSRTSGAERGSGYGADTRPAPV